jgi:hypothetical protein
MITVYSGSAGSKKVFVEHITTKGDGRMQYTEACKIAQGILDLDKEVPGPLGPNLSRKERQALHVLINGAQLRHEQLVKTSKYIFDDGVTYTDNLTLEQALKFVALQGGGSVRRMPQPRRKRSQPLIKL